MACFQILGTFQNHWTYQAEIQPPRRDASMAAGETPALLYATSLPVRRSVGRRPRHRPDADAGNVAAVSIRRPPRGAVRRRPPLLPGADGEGEARAVAAMDADSALTARQLRPVRQSRLVRHRAAAGDGAKSVLRRVEAPRPVAVADALAEAVAAERRVAASAADGRHVLPRAAAVLAAARRASEDGHHRRRGACPFCPCAARTPAVFAA
ncbi:MAG: hypothetical protein QOC81_3845 [Thermoanaerobaculia bacterium]|jgi:hypothetical protein|nr:hypothetical protein [Thermoanaerobaculia bacterium]